MAENFVEKELGKSLENEEQNASRDSQYADFDPEVLANSRTQIVEKIVYKKQRIHGFFRTLTILALAAVGFLMLAESTGLIKININGFPLDAVYPLFVIISAVIIWSYRWVFAKIFGVILFLLVLGWLLTIEVYTMIHPSDKWEKGNQINYTTTHKNNDINFQTLIGNIYLEWKPAHYFVQGTRNSDRELKITSWVVNTIASLQCTEDNNRNVLQKSKSNLDISIDTDTNIHALNIKQFFWQEVIDLTRISREHVALFGGINNLNVTLGEIQEGSSIEIQWMMANLDIHIPKDVWVSLYYKHFVGFLSVQGFTALSGNIFQSQNYATAKKKMTMTIKLGIGNTTIDWITP